MISLRKGFDFTNGVESKLAIGSWWEKPSNVFGGETVTNAGDDAGRRFRALDEERELIKELIFGTVFVPMEEVRFGAVREPELVDADQRIEGDESDDGGVGDEIEGLGERRSEEIEFVGEEASVNDEEEDGRRGRGEGVGEILDGCGVREKLRGEIGIGDRGVSRREGVAIEAERAAPCGGGEVDDGVRV